MTSTLDPRRPGVVDGAAHPPSHDVPRSLDVASAWAWRVLLVLAALAAIVVTLQTVSTVVIPLAVSLLLAVLLWPAVRRLTNRTPLKRGAASLITVVLFIAFVGGLLALTGTQIVSGLADLRTSAEQGLNEVTDWLRTGPLGISSDQLTGYIDSAKQSLSENSSTLTSGALAAGTSAGHFLAGMLISLIATFFYLAEGDKIWRFLLRMMPERARESTYQASRRGWVSLGSYARTQVLVAAVDAVGIGLGAFVLGLPLAVPLTLLVFLASFIPIVGAIASGAVAVLVALVVKGPVVALIMLGVVLVVQQLESHVLQPFLMGKAVSLHPLAVICAVAIGSLLLGIVGALFSVPFLAVLNTVVRYFHGIDQFPELGTQPMPGAEEDAGHDPKGDQVTPDVRTGDGRPVTPETTAGATLRPGD